MTVYVTPESSGGGLAPGPAPAIDANHLHVYTCDDTAGSFLVDTGYNAANRVDASLLGVDGVSYALNSPRPFRYGTSGLRLLADNASTGAQAVVPAMGSGPYTIECFGLLDEYVSTGPTVDIMVGIDDGTNNNSLIFGCISSGLVFGGVIIGSVDRNTTTPDAQTAQPVQLGVPSHWMLVYDPGAATTLKLIRNGTRIADNDQQSAAMPSLSRITIGNRGVLGAPSRGAIAQVRVSNIARPESYSLECSEILFRM